MLGRRGQRRKCRAGLAEERFLKLGEEFINGGGGWNGGEVQVRPGAGIVAAGVERAVTPRGSQVTGGW